MIHGRPWFDHRRAAPRESTHVTWLGTGSRKDWTIVRRAVSDGYELVTNNAADFRARTRT
jgi:hypothetical protein